MLTFGAISDPKGIFLLHCRQGVSELKLVCASVVFLPSNFSEASGSVKW